MYMNRKIAIKKVILFWTRSYATSSSTSKPQNPYLSSNQASLTQSFTSMHTINPPKNTNKEI
jgi:hypothetical protein